MHGFGRERGDRFSTMADTGFAIDVSPNIAIPERTVTVDGTDFTVDAIGKVYPGDSVTVSVTVDDPSIEYTIQIRDPEEFIRRNSGPTTGDTTVTFDTGPTENKEAMEPRSYGAAAVVSGNVRAFQPLVVSGYSVSVRAPGTALAGGDTVISATVDELDSTTEVPSIDRLETIVWTPDSETRETMTAVDGDTYRAAVAKSADEYDLSVTVVTTDASDDGDPEPVGFSDPQSLSIVENTGQLGQDWSIPTGERLQYSEPTVTSGSVFVGGLGRAVTSYDRPSGESQWSTDRSGMLSDSSPAYDSERGRVYLGGGGGVLYALDATDGGQAWTYSTDSAITATPAVLDGVVYVGTNDGRILARDAADGSARWTTTVGGPVFSALETSSDSVLVTTADGDVVSLSTTGSEQWRYSTPGRLGSASPAYRSGSGTVYVAGDSVVALDAATGEALWTVEDYVGGVGATPAVAGGVVYVGGGDNQVHALENGARLWSFGLTDGVAARPGVVGDRLVVADLGGTVGVLDRSTGSWIEGCTLATPIRSPVVVESGDAFVGTRGGDVAVFESV